MDEDSDEDSDDEPLSKAGKKRYPHRQRKSPSRRAAPVVRSKRNAARKEGTSENVHVKSNQMLLLVILSPNIDMFCLL